MTFETPSEDPPKKEMVFFPGMTTSLPSESAEFRRVLWTGLYSQLVLMTVPVGGDIGDEVSGSVLSLTAADKFAETYSRSDLDVYLRHRKGHNSRKGPRSKGW